MAGEGQLRVGDTVQLKSGGPKMTVIETQVPPGGGVMVVWAGWFAGAKYEKAKFDVRSLIVPSDEKPKDK